MKNEALIPMHIDDLNDAIRATINSLGGMKAVGAEMRPEKLVVDAGKWLADCINPEKRDRLSPEQLSFIRRRGRMAGCDILASFEMREAGYGRPVPIAPEAAQLRREFIASVKSLRDLQTRMEHHGLRVAA